MSRRAKSHVLDLNVCGNIVYFIVIRDKFVYAQAKRKTVETMDPFKTFPHRTDELNDLLHSNLYKCFPQFDSFTTMYKKFIANDVLSRLSVWFAASHFNFPIHRFLRWAKKLLPPVLSFIHYNSAHQSRMRSITHMHTHTQGHRI